jgi:ABC-type uncharacterized transport system substrate-binding protein
MDRRRFLLTSLAGALATPLAAEAQQGRKVWRVGLLAAGPYGMPQAFLPRLAELGYREDHNVEILRHFHHGTQSRIPALASDLVTLKPDVIVAVAPPTAYAVQKLTTTIPIVFVSVGRPVEAGLVSNLVRPGANITGISLDVTPDVHAKQVQLLNDAIRGGTVRMAVVWNPNNPGIDEYVKATERAASTTGITMQSIPIRDAADRETAVSQASRGNQGLIALPDLMIYLNRQRLTALCATYRLPAIYWFREVVEEGGLMSYGADLQQIYRRGADYVDKILRGAKPADLPVEQPTKFELVINLKTAKALGLTIPPSLLARADHVIE